MLDPTTGPADTEDMTTTYPTDGAAHHARTGKTKFQTVLDDANIPAEHMTAVALFANYVLNTSPGYRPSDAAYYAVRCYQTGGIEAVTAR